MKLWPDSLAARTVLLVLAVVAIAEITTFSLVYKDRDDAHRHRIVRHIAGQIHLLRDVLPGLDDASRKRLESAEPGEQWLQLLPDGDAIPRERHESKQARKLAEEIRRVLGTPVRLREAGHGPRGGLWIGFEAGGESWWLILPPPRFEPQELPHDLWMKLGGALLALLVIAGLFVRSIVRPLRELGEAVSATGKGRASKVLPTGPREVRRLAERHNTTLTQLEQADSERREMLAGLTHDLRAPLARLRVRLALLENEGERAGFARDAEDMERIVDQCLAFLRSEESDCVLAEPLLIADVVSDEVARHRELGRNIEISVSGAAAPCRVEIARSGLQRVLDNLIENALQYGAPPVEVSLSVDSPRTVTLAVRDCGPGIPAEERDRAMEAFAQIEPARATRGSCGLGLAIVHRIVDGSGGEMRLGDAPGGGLEVLIRWPALDAEDPA